MKAYFIVTTYGRTASYWLASLLNKHPDIICSHGSLMDICSPYDIQPLKERTIKAHNRAGSFVARTIDQFLDELENTGQAKAYGDVHGYDLVSVIEKSNLEKTRHKIVVSNLTRHPITRIESLKNEWLYEITFSPILRRILSEYDPTKVNMIQSRFKHIDFTVPDNWVFVVALLKTITSDLRELPIDFNHITMERLTGDPELLLHFINKITQGAVSISSSFIEDMINSDRYNKRSNSKRFSLSVFDSWEEWKRTVFKLVLDKYKVWELYSSFGYDLSFVRRGDVGRQRQTKIMADKAIGRCLKVQS